MKGQQYVAEPLSYFTGSFKTWGVTDLNTGELLLDWRIRNNKRRLFRASKDECDLVAKQLSEGTFTIPKADVSTRTRAILNTQRRKRSRVATGVAPIKLAQEFHKCTSCGRMVRGKGHTCS